MGILKITEQLNKMKKLLFISIFLAFVASINAQTIIAGMNGAQLRAAINNKVIALSDSLATVADSIVAHTSSIQLRLLKSDTASMLGNYTRNGELNSALAAKVNVSDTAAMLSHYALTSELGDAGIAIGDVRDEIADSLNVLRPLYVAAADTAAMLNPYAKLTDLSDGGIGIGAVQEEIADSLNVLRAAVTVGNGTKAPYFDGSQDGGQILYFYGDNGFYTALQGGAPVANRSYRLPIAALPSAGTTSLMNIDEYGNMGFVASTTYAPTANPTFTGVQKVSTTDTLATKAYARSVGGGDIATLETRVDSIVDVLADTANLETVLQFDLDTDTLATKAYARSVGGGGTAGITLNSGTLTLNGSEGTADDITFYTNGDGSYDLPAGGGNLTIMSQVQGWIADSLNNIRNNSIPGIALADSMGFAPGNYVTHTQLAAFSGGSCDSTSVHSRIDSLSNIVEELRADLENVWSAIASLGDFDLVAPRFTSAEVGNRADDVVVVKLDAGDVQQDSIPPASAFTLWNGALTHGIDAVDIGHDTLYLAIDSAAVYGRTYTLDYTRGTPALQDSTGNKSANWTARTVTNNTEELEDPDAFYAEYETVLAAFGDDPSETVQGYQNAFVKALVDAGYWARMDVLYIFASNTSGNALLNWKNPAAYTATIDNLGTRMSFTAYQGFTELNNYGEIIIPFNPSTNGVNYTLNSASFGIYFRISQNANNTYGIYSPDDATNMLQFEPYSYSNLHTRINSSSELSLTATNWQGMFVGSRTSSTAVAVYKNEASHGSGTLNSTALPNSTIGLNSETQNQVSVFFLANGLNSTDANAIAGIINTYMTSLGTNVY